MDEQALLLPAAKQFDRGSLVDANARAKELAFKTHGGLTVKPTFTVAQIAFLISKVLRSATGQHMTMTNKLATACTIKWSANCICSQTDLNYHN